MKTRVVSSIVALPLLFFFLIAGGALLKGSIFVLTAFGMIELCKAVSGEIKPIHFLSVLAELLYIVFIDCSLPVIYYSIATMLFVMAMLIYFVFTHSKNSIKDVTVTAFAFIYVGVMISSIYTVRQEHFSFVWLPFVCAFGTDTGAYFAGRFFGKHKLAPVLSPKKTIEGSVGGIITSLLLCIIYGAVLSGKATDKTAFMLVFVFIGIICSILAQLGDLSASAIKRETGIKDYGKIMPGHGGVMDRFDSVIFTAPAVYIFTKLIELLGLIG